MQLQYIRCLFLVDVRETLSLLGKTEDIRLPFTCICKKDRPSNEPSSTLPLLPIRHKLVAKIGLRTVNFVIFLQNAVPNASGNIQIPLPFTKGNVGLVSAVVVRAARGEQTKF